LQRVTDTTYDTTGQRLAENLHTSFSDKATAVVIPEFVDLLFVFQVMSKKFQSKGGLMLGNVQIIRDGFQKLTKLKSAPGKSLKAFLDQCNCPGVCEVGKCNLNEYDSCQEVYKGDIPLQATCKLTSWIAVGPQTRTLLEDPVMFTLSQ